MIPLVYQVSTIVHSFVEMIYDNVGESLVGQLGLC
jgi:hypothetical protein